MTPIEQAALAVVRAGLAVREAKRDFVSVWRGRMRGKPPMFRTEIDRRSLEDIDAELAEILAEELTARLRVLTEANNKLRRLFQEKFGQV